MNSENIGELMASLAKAQGEMSAASKDSKNPFFNSKYADLSSVWNACRDALSKHGLAVVQTMQKDEVGQLYLKTMLGHSSGQWIASLLPINVRTPDVPELDKHGKPKKINEMQALGSVLTYLRRYALAAIVGVAPDEDDDGNSQSYNHPKAKLTDGDVLGYLAKFGGESVMMLQWLKWRTTQHGYTLQQELDWFLDEKYQDKMMNDFKKWKLDNEVKKA